MSGIKAFPKIFTIGQDYVSKIFDDEVEITEKIDGSQFVFGKDKEGHLHMRSKGAIIYPENVQKLFAAAVEHVLSIQDRLPNDAVYYCEVLHKPKHNTLEYARIPKNHLVLWGTSNFMGDKFQDWHADLVTTAAFLDVEPVKLLYKGLIPHPEALLEFMELESQLGGTEAEGVVVKNYNQQFLLGGQPIPVMAGKYVSEKFKEVHRTSWSKQNTSAGKWQEFKNGYNTEARWHKAIQHLNEQGLLEHSPRDIGKLIKAIKDDIVSEEQEVIKNFLWKQFGEQVLHTACIGFPEFYKKQLLERSFIDAPTEEDK